MTIDTTDWEERHFNDVPIGTIWAVTYCNPVSVLYISTAPGQHNLNCMAICGECKGNSYRMDGMVKVCKYPPHDDIVGDI